MTPRERVLDTFAAEWGSPPAFLVRAPGRVNLIGEHTDYNDGFVLPMAIDRAVWIALRPRQDRQVRVLALDFDANWLEFQLDALERGPASPAEYLKGVAWALQEAGHPCRAGKAPYRAMSPLARGCLLRRRWSWPPCALLRGPLAFLWRHQTAPACASALRWNGWG
ncbi:MAG: hypothetical protein HC915_15945 [Anaerolineae bacterium]|nr:hypothetical protein [Anaerolineae bacterium]